MMTGQNRAFRFRAKRVLIGLGIAAAALAYLAAACWAGCGSLLEGGQCG